MPQSRARSGVQPAPQSSVHAAHDAERHAIHAIERRAARKTAVCSSRRKALRRPQPRSSAIRRRWADINQYTQEFGDRFSGDAFMSALTEPQVVLLGEAMTRAADARGSG